MLTMICQDLKSEDPSITFDIMNLHHLKVVMFGSLFFFCECLQHEFRITLQMSQALILTWLHCNWNILFNYIAINPSNHLEHQIKIYFEIFSTKQLNSRQLRNSVSDRLYEFQFKWHNFNLQQFWNLPLYFVFLVPSLVWMGQMNDVLKLH